MQSPIPVRFLIVFSVPKVHENLSFCVPVKKVTVEILTFDLGAVAYRERFSLKTMSCVQVSAESAVWLDSTALKKQANMTLVGPF